MQVNEQTRLAADDSYIQSAHNVDEYMDDVIDDIVEAAKLDGKVILRHRKDKQQQEKLL